MPAILTDEFRAYVTQLEVGDGSLAPFASPVISVNIDGLADTPAQYEAAVTALEAWQDATGLAFFLTSDQNANILMENEEAGAAYANVVALTDDGLHAASTFLTVAKDWMADFPADQQWGNGSYGLQTFIHEIGHTLGLYHGGNYNGDADYDADASFWIDTLQYSVMSYFDQSNHGGATALNVSSPMIADIIAIGELYDDFAVHSGNTTYGRGEKTTLGGISDLRFYPNAAYTIVDTGGRDVIDLRDGTKASLLDLRGGYFSDINGNKGNLAIEFDTVIENAFGTKAGDRIIGNAVANILSGLGGTDRILGGGGNDTLKGGLGNDRLYGDAGSDSLFGEAGKDVFVFAATSGRDRILDFQDGFDRIGFSDKTISFADLEIYAVGKTAVVDYGDGLIKLAEIDDSALSRSDFAFGIA